MSNVAEILNTYLLHVINAPGNAALDIGSLPEDFRVFAEKFAAFTENVLESKEFAYALADGNLHCKIPPQSNDMASPLRIIHALLTQMTWQSAQVAKGDYSQRLSFAGDFAEAFNQMIGQLEAHKIMEAKERLYLHNYLNLILMNSPDMLIIFDPAGKAVLANNVLLKNISCKSALEIRGKSLYGLLGQTSADVVLHDIDLLFKQAAEDKCTRRIRRRFDMLQDGKLRSYDIFVTPLLFENDVITGIMLIFREVYTQGR